jgi:arylformamidase
MEFIVGRRLIDVTMPLSPALPVWPGDPAFEVGPVARIVAGDVCNVSRLTMSSHAGTHVDAPRHFSEARATIDEIPLSRLIGRCVVTRIADAVRRIEPDHLETANIPVGTTRLLLRTANAARWRMADGADVTAGVVLSPAAARWVVARGIALIGIDGLSIEAADDVANETHRTLLGAGVLIVEGLDLSAVEPGPYGLVCLPLRLAGGDGAPVRVVLVADSRFADD